MVLAGYIALSALGAAALPFPTRDQNPLLAGAGLPVPVPARIASDASWDATLDLNWSNSALLQETAGESLLVDAESRELRLTLQHSVSNRIALRAQIPWRDTTEGTLDGFIDDWHDLFGLPEGIRPLLPRDSLRVRYIVDGVRELDVRESSRGLGDITLGAGLQLYADERSAWSTWLQIELPTGEARELNGNGATDVSLIVAASSRLAQRWTAFGQLAATWTAGDVDLLDEQQRDLVWSAMGGIGWRAWRGLTLKAQVDAHSAAYDSELDFLGESLMLTVGADYATASGWQFDLGVSEDIAVETAPDVVFVFGVRRSF